MGDGQPGDSRCRPKSPVGLASREPLPPLPPLWLPPLALPPACSSAIWLRSSQFSMVVSRQHRVTSAARQPSGRGQTSGHTGQASSQL